MRGGIVRFTHNSALFRPIDLIEYSVLHYAVNTDKYKLQAVLHTMRNALEV